MVSCKFH